MFPRRRLRRPPQLRVVFTACFPPTSFPRAGKSCFSTLFKFEEMQEIVKNFTLIHIDTPGQEEGAAAYPSGYAFISSVTSF